ncbi:MAG TPA: TfoX/Sxy family protein [Actinomycetota bacterium]|jgi:hypothetical protein
MAAPSSSPSDVQRFFELQRTKLLREKDITEKRMFGTTALCVHGKVFMFPWKENLVLKLPEERVSRLLASQNGEHFDPGHGRTSRTWVAVLPKAKRQWSQLATAARQFVDS